MRRDLAADEVHELAAIPEPGGNQMVVAVRVLDDNDGRAGPRTVALAEDPLPFGRVERHALGTDARDIIVTRSIRSTVP